MFGCFGNCGLCLITYIAPCYTAGKNAEAVGESCCCRGCVAMLGPIGIWSMATIRGKIREQKGIEVCTTDNQELHFLQNDPFQLFIHLELYRPPGKKKNSSVELKPYPINIKDNSYYRNIYITEIYMYILIEIYPLKR